MAFATSATEADSRSHTTGPAPSERTSVAWSGFRISPRTLSPRAASSGARRRPIDRCPPAIATSMPLQPPALAEVPDHPDQQRQHRAQDHPERGLARLAGDPHVHPPDARYQGEWEDDHAERGQHPQDLVHAVREHRLVRVLEGLHDLLEVLEHVPDPLGGVDDVVEVDLEVLGQVALLGALEVAQHRALRPDDLAEVDDLLLRVRDVAHDLLGATLEDVLLDPLELDAHLAEHREAVVERVVDDLVEQVARALREQRLAHLLGGAAALEQVLDRRQRRVRQRDQVVGPDEHVELARVEPPDRLVEHREVENDEQVVGVLVDLRPLVARQDVLVVERVELEVLLEPRLVEWARTLDVDPAQA